MTAPYPERVKEIFGLALELPVERREGFIEEQCAGDQALRDAVLELLRKHDEVPTFFDDGAEPYLRREPSRRDFQGNERFEVIRQLGGGGFGAVFEALDRNSGTHVGLKVLDRPRAGDLRMFKREFRTLSEVTHANIVQLYELFDDGRHWFFTMELVRGTDFVSWAGQSASSARRALAQLADAVCYLHGRRILHRDIKPPNVLVTGDGRVKLLDFGLVRDVSQDPAARTETLAGTAAYMAPELLTDHTLREASDWYSVGALLYEALTGRPPFDGPLVEVLWRKNAEPARPPRELRPDIPGDLNDLCLALLERDPKARLTGSAVLDCLSGGKGFTKFAEPASPAAPPLVGRESHLASLHEALEDVRAGHTVCVHVQGRSGMGKTALCRQFASEAREGGAVFFSGRCYESESVPFKALDPVIDSIGDHLRSLGERAAAFLPREKPLQALARLFPTLLSVDVIRAAWVEPAGDASPRDMQRRAMAALKEILGRMAEKNACVVHIDDFQWGDVDSVDCLAGILSPPDPPRALFLFSYRSEDASSARPLERFLTRQRDPLLYSGRLRELEVDRLTSPQTRELLRVLLGSGAEQAAASIDREAEGMPLFIHELALHARPTAALAIPKGLSLQEMIGRRVSELPASAKALMEVISLAAQPVDIDLASEAAGARGEAVARHVLLAQRLIRFKAGGRQVEPYHDKVREAVVSGIAPGIRIARYLSLATAMEKRENADPEAVWQYFHAAGEMERAEAWIALAAERAERALAFDLAVKLRERHLEMRTFSDAERSLLLERLAQALALAGQGLRAAQTYQSAARGADPGRSLQLVRKAGEQYVRSGHFEQGQALLCALLEKTGFRIPAHRWQALAMLAARRCLLRLRGLRFEPRPSDEVPLEEAEKLDICRVTSLALTIQDPIRSAELQTRHLLSSLQLGEPYRIANSLAMEAGYVVARGGAAAYGEASKLLDKVEQLALQSNHPNGRTLADSVRCKAAWLAGRWEESAKFGERVNRMATEQYTRVAWEAYPSSMFWICALACMGRWQEAVGRLPGLQADSESRGDLLEMTSLPVFTFAYIRWLLADQPDRAAEELENARARLSEPGFIPQRFGVCFGLTEVALYTLEAERAAQALAQGWAQLGDAMVLRIQPVRIFMLHLRARVACARAAARTEPQARKKFLSQALGDARRIRRERTVWGRGIANLIEAAVAAEERRFADASRLLQAGERDCREVGMQQFVCASRWLQSHMTGEGASSVNQERAGGWFTEQKVSKPHRLVRMLCPGTWPLP
jgi:hypothetical protein